MASFRLKLRQRLGTQIRSYKSAKKGAIVEGANINRLKGNVALQMRTCSNDLYNELGISYGCANNTVEAINLTGRLVAS